MAKKETYFFTHDYGARNDPKLQRVLMRLKQEGKGIFWDIIEMLYEQGGVLSLNFEELAFMLHADADTVKDLICNYDLFCNDGKVFWSESVNRRLQKRRDVSEKRKQAVNSYWERVKSVESSECVPEENDTNVLQAEYKCNTIKEKKIKEKERKENNSSVLPDDNTPQTDILINEQQCESVSATQLAELFNKNCPSLPRIVRLSDVRKAKLILRYKEMGSLETYTQVLKKMENTPFLKGQNNNGWKANIDWLIANDYNWTKVLEGNYDDVAVKEATGNKINNVNDFWT